MAFEIVFRLMLSAIATPALILLLRVTMKLSGIKYLSGEGIADYISNPFTIVAIVLILLVSAMFTLVELSGLSACFSCIGRGRKISSASMMRTGFKALAKALSGKGFIKFIAFTIYMPMAQFTLSSGVFLSPLMPVLRTVFSDIDSSIAIAVYILIQLMFVIIIASRCYSLHFLILTDRDFPDCTRESKRIISGHKARTALTLVLWSVAMLAVAFTVTFVISFTVLLFIKGFSSPKKAFLSSLKVLRYAGQIFSAVSVFLSAPAIVCWITEKFFSDIEPDEKIKFPQRRTNMGIPAKALILTITAGVGIMLNMTYIRAIHEGNLNLNTGLLSRTQITAHRGFSGIAPENTVYSFGSAVESGADYIELDVQLTKDNQLVVFHDKTIDRTTDGKGKLSDYTYDELLKFSVGEWYGKEEYNDAKIMLLSEVLELFSDDILFNIEIKNSGNVVRTAEITAETVQEYGIEDSCYITSFSYSALKKVKSINPDIKTGIIVNTAVSAFSQLQYTDAVSMNYLFVNHTAVTSVHQNGKKLFVWTVNRTEDIQKMVAMGVDNIITNRPDRASEIVYSGSVSQKILTLVKTLFEL